MTQVLTDRVQSALNDLLDDLTSDQFRMLIDWLWVNQLQASRRNINSFRLQVGLPR